MPYENEANEMGTIGKDQDFNLAATPFSHHDTESDAKVEAVPKQRMPLLGENGENLDSVTRIRRLFSFAQIFAFSLTFMSTWEGMNTMFFALYEGGPQVFAWSILIVYIGALLQAASIAEMASTVPIAGAQYHWTYHLAPQSIKRFTTWMQGWMTWFGWVSLLAGVTNVTAIILQQLAVLNNPNYVPQTWHLSLIMIAILFTQGLINSIGWTFALVPWLELAAGILHVCLFIVFMAVYTTMGTRQGGAWIFLEHQVSSGWTNTYVAWNLGLLTCVWSFTGFDGAVHMSEEVRKAKQAVPRATFWSIAMNGALAYAMVIAILSSMDSMDEILDSVFPVTTILLRVTGSAKATTAMICGIFIISLCVTIASIASVSRLTWAWARDGGLPRWFAYVHPKHLVPVRAIWLALIIVMFLSLLNIGSTTAFGAMTALSSFALYFSYAIAIFSMLYARWISVHGGRSLELGAWNLGHYGVYINLCAFLYTVYCMIWLPIPTALPVTAANMNYASPIFLFVFFFALFLWFVRASRIWRGPDVAIIDLIKAQE